MSVVKIARKNRVALGLVALVRKPVVNAFSKVCSSLDSSTSFSPSSTDLGLLRNRLMPRYRM
ncbi:hypothetical protein D3C78_1891100 [compost metagenome]